jgi:fructokinase
MDEWFAGIEAGGTKFNCIIANDPEHILAEARVETTTPGETIPRICDFFTNTIMETGIQIRRIGLGLFGPLDLDPKSATFGSITSTPKTAWRNVPVLSLIQNELGIPATLDTDVNAAAIGEGTWGAARGVENYIYITIGTGIGGGVVVDGKPVHGLVHPELGHIVMNHNKILDPFEGFCPYHKDCWEGLAAGPAIFQRWNIPAQLLPEDHPAWDLEADYIAQALQSIILTLSPQKIILGGGVMNHPGLIDMIRVRTRKFLNNYVDHPAIKTGMGEYIVPPTLGYRAGVLGAVALARM